MKKILYVVISMLLVLTITACKINNSDSLKFKEEYESLNNKSNENNGKKYRSISIPKDNPFIYKTADELVDMLQNKESFIVYFGFNSCPWCRSVLPTLIEVSKNLNIDKIYYVDVSDIRDTIVVNEDGELQTTKEGTKGYYKLIDLLKDVLSDYKLTNKDGKAISANEARIYAPNVVRVERGKGISLTTGVSELQTDGYMDLTDDMIKETYSKFEKVLK